MFALDIFMSVHPVSRSVLDWIVLKFPSTTCIALLPRLKVALGILSLTLTMTRWLELEDRTESQIAAPAADGLRCLTDQDKTAGHVSSPVPFCGTIR